MNTPKTRPTTDLDCECCGVVVTKENRTIARNDRDGKPHVCSRSCGLAMSHRVRQGVTYGFAYYIKVAKSRAVAKGLSFDLTSEYLAELYSGRCALTGMPILLKKKSDKEKLLHYASIDRIDNKFGYLQGNVQFVAMGINYMRNTVDVDSAKEFIDKIRKSIAG